MFDYWTRIHNKALELGGDGCSGVPDFYKDCCDEHDIHYRTHQTIDGQPITRPEADARFRECIQSRSIFGIMSPMSWWRWVGLRIGGRRAWSKE